MIKTDGKALIALMQQLEFAILAAIGVPLMMLMLAAIAGNMLQHRLVWSAESLTPKFSKISPGAGFKRIFGKQAAANFLKGIGKLVALSVVMTMILWPERHRMEAMVRLDPAAMLGASTSMTIHLLGAVVARSRSSPLATISSSTAAGSSGRRCRSRRSRKSSSSPKATRTSRASSGSCASNAPRSA